MDDSEEYVVDGKPVRLTKAQRALHFQKGLAADKRLKEAADARKKSEDFQKLLETDFEAAVRQAGHDPEKLYAAQLERKAKQELMTDEQRRFAQLEQERDAAKADAEKVRKEQTKAKQDALDEANFGRLRTEIVASAERLKLDETPDVLEGICDIAMEFLEYGVELTTDQAAQEYIRREREHVETKDKKLTSILSGKKLLEYLGKETLAKIDAARKEADAESLKGVPAPQARIKVAAHERSVKPKTGHMSELEFDRKFLK